MIELSATPEPPYYAVIFTTVYQDDLTGYAEMGEDMYALASQMPGFLGIEGADAEGSGEISVTYWRDEASIRAWKDKAEHLVAQKLGRERWFERYVIRIAKVERAYTYDHADA